MSVGAAVLPCCPWCGQRLGSKEHRRGALAAECEGVSVVPKLFKVLGILLDETGKSPPSLWLYSLSTPGYKDRVFQICSGSLATELLNLHTEQLRHGSFLVLYAMST